MRTLDLIGTSVLMCIRSERVFHSGLVVKQRRGLEPRIGELLMFQVIVIGGMAALVMGWLVWQWWTAALETGAITTDRAPTFEPGPPRRTTGRTTRRTGPSMASPHIANLHTRRPHTTTPLRRSIRPAA